MNQRTADDFEFVIELFKQFRKSEPDGSILGFVEAHEISELHVVADLVSHDIEFNTIRNSAIPVRTYFELFPKLRTDSDLSRMILDHDFKSQFQLGLCTDQSEYRTGDQLLDVLFDGPEENSNGLRDSVAPKYRTDAAAVGSLVGRKIQNYEVTGLISAGRKAEVYKAKDHKLGRSVVLKVTNDISRQTTNEARFLAKLEHPNILSVHEEFEAEGRQFIVTRFIDGVSLGDLIDFWHQGKPLGSSNIQWRFDCIGRTRVRTVIELVLAIASAARHAHNHGVLHCDIKPSNVLIEPTGNPLLLDFDIAIQAESGRESIGGTVGYASPEQSTFLIRKNDASRRQVDHRTDLYSIGVVMFEGLTGALPNQSTQPEILSKLNKVPGTTRSLASIIAKSLDPTPDDRYQSSGELIEDLNRWLSGRSLRYALDSYPPEKFLRLVRRHPIVLALVAIAAAIGIAAVVQSSQRIEHVERSLSQLEQDLEFSKSINLQHIADTILETKASLARNQTLDFLFQSKRKNASERLQILLWKLARREDALLIDHATPNSPTEIQTTHEPHSDAVKFVVANYAGGTETKPMFPDHRNQLSMIEQGLAELLSRPSEFDKIVKSSFLKIAFPSFSAPLRSATVGDATRNMLLLEKLAMRASTKVGSSHAAPTNSTMPSEQAGPSDSLPESLTEAEWHLLGVRLELAGNRPLATSCFQRAVDIQLGSGRLPVLTTVIHLANGYVIAAKDDRAKRYLEMAAVLDPTDHAIFHRLGLLAERMNSRNQAIRHLRSAIELSPSSANYYVDLGAIYIRAERPLLAIRSLDEAIKRGYEKPDARTNHAIATYLSGNVDDAVSELEAIVSKFPDEKPAASLLRKLKRQNMDSD